MEKSSFNLKVIDIGNNCTHELTVRWFSSIKDIKDLLKAKTNVLPSNQRLFHSLNPRSLSNNLTLHDLGIAESGHTLSACFHDSQTEENYNLTISKGLEDSRISEMIADIRTGLNRGQVPAKTDVFDCTGGVYFMRSGNGAYAGVFKPQDEEQGMTMNSKGYSINSLRPNFKPGEGCIREMASYIMDKDNFSSVPPTALIHCEHPTFNYPSRNNVRMVSKNMYPKMGSLQLFIRACDSFENLGTAVLSDFEVQKIALLDMRLLNCDRNASNILAIYKTTSPKNLRWDCSRSDSVTSTGSWENPEERDLVFDSEDGDGGVGSGTYALIPIDHGYCIPSRLKISELDWTWFYYPHIKREIHPDIKKYLLSLNIEELITEMTSQVAVSEDCLFLLRLTHTLLVEGITQNMTLFELANIIARLDEDVPSPLENVISLAEENAYRSIEMRSGRLDSRSLSNNKITNNSSSINSAKKKNENITDARLSQRRWSSMTFEPTEEYNQAKMNDNSFPGVFARRPVDCLNDFSHDYLLDTDSGTHLKLQQPIDSPTDGSVCFEGTLKTSSLDMTTSATSSGDEGGSEISLSPPIVVHPRQTNKLCCDKSIPLEILDNGKLPSHRSLNVFPASPPFVAFSASYVPASDQENKMNFSNESNEGEKMTDEKKNDEKLSLHIITSTSPMKGSANKQQRTVGPPSPSNLNSFSIGCSETRQVHSADKMARSLYLTSPRSRLSLVEEEVDCDDSPEHLSPDIGKNCVDVNDTMGYDLDAPSLPPSNVCSPSSRNFLVQKSKTFKRNDLKPFVEDENSENVYQIADLGDGSSSDGAISSNGCSNTSGSDNGDTDNDEKVDTHFVQHIELNKCASADGGNVGSRVFDGRSISYSGTSRSNRTHHDDEDDDIASVCPPLPFKRVVSFTGFESAPIYDKLISQQSKLGAVHAERRVSMLRRERRRSSITNTFEFNRLRVEFGLTAVKDLIGKEIRKKLMS